MSQNPFKHTIKIDCRGATDDLIKRLPSILAENNRKLIRRMEEERAFHYGITWWRKLRAYKLSETPLCEICRRPAQEVDHIIPISKGGAARDYENLRSLCVSCHSKKTAEDKGGKANWGCDQFGNPLDPNSHWK